MDHRLPRGRTKLVAHDIRHLGLCAICGGIADQRTSISYETAYGYKAQDPNAMWHPKCTFDYFGEKFVLDLPKSEQEKFCLSDIPVETMKKLISDDPSLPMNRRYAPKPHHAADAVQAVIARAAELVDYIRHNHRKHITEVKLIEAIDDLRQADMESSNDR